MRNFISWTAWGGYFENIDYNWIKGSLFIKNLFEAARQNNEDVAEKTVCMLKNTEHTVMPLQGKRIQKH